MRPRIKTQINTGVLVSSSSARGFRKAKTTVTTYFYKEGLFNNQIISVVSTKRKRQ